MPRRLAAILDKLERFMVRATRHSFDELVVVIVAIFILIGILALGDLVAGSIGAFVGVGLVMPIYAACGILMHRGHARERRENPASAQLREEEERRRLPRDYVSLGILSLALFGLGFLGAIYLPGFHPLHGKLWFGFCLLFALAPGSILIGIAGFLDERVCLAVTHHAKKLSLPLWTRLLGWTLLLGGFAVGGYLAFLMRT